MSGNLAMKLAFVREILAYDMANAGANDSAIAIMKAQMNRYISYAKMGMSVEAMPEPQSANNKLDELVLVVLSDLANDQGELAVVQNGGAIPPNATQGNGVQAGYGYYYYYPYYWYNWYYGYNNYWGGYYNRWYPYYYWYNVYAGSKRAGQAQNANGGFFADLFNGITNGPQNAVPNAQVNGTGGDMNAIQNAVSNAVNANAVPANAQANASPINAVQNGAINGSGVPVAYLNGNASKQLPKIVNNIDKRFNSAHLNCDADGDCTYNASFKALEKVNVNEGHLTCDADNLCTYTIRFKRQ